MQWGKHTDFFFSQLLFLHVLGKRLVFHSKETKGKKGVILGYTFCGLWEVLRDGPRHAEIRKAGYHFWGFKRYVGLTKRALRGDFVFLLFFVGKSKLRKEVPEVPSALRDVWTLTCLIH